MDEFKITKEEENIIESAKDIVLNASEKSEIKARVISYMNSNPVESVPHPKTKSVYSVFDFIYHRSTFLVPAIAVVLLVFGLNSNSKPEQLASLDNLETAKMDTVGAEATFSTMSAPAEMQVQLMQVNEKESPAEVTNTRMMKSAPVPSAMMMAVTADESTSTATTTKKTSVSRLKDHINVSYKSFISRFFNKTKKEDKKESKDEDKDDKNVEKKIEEKKDDDIKVSSGGSGSYNDRNEDEDERESEDDDDKDEDRSGDDNLPVVDPLPPVKGTSTPVTTNIISYTLVQVSSHNTSADCWSVVSGGVYNLTSWIAKHPGGQSAIKGMCGVDGTVGFLAQHNGDTKAVNTLVSYKIGIVK